MSMRKVVTGEITQYESDAADIENRRMNQQEKLFKEHVVALTSIEIDYLALRTKYRILFNESESKERTDALQKQFNKEAEIFDLKIGAENNYFKLKLKAVNDNAKEELRILDENLKKENDKKNEQKTDEFLKRQKDEYDERIKLQESYEENVNDSLNRISEAFNVSLDESKKRQEEIDKILQTRRKAPPEEFDDIENSPEILAFRKTMEGRKQILEVALKSEKITREQYNEEIKAIDDEYFSNLMDKVNMGLQAASDAVNQILSFSMSEFRTEQDNKLKAIDEQYNKENEQLDKLRKNNLISEREYNKRKEKLDEEKAAKERILKEEAWKKEKEANIIRALMNTAVAVTAALTQVPIGWVMAGIVAGLGALQVGLIEAQTMPKFHTGGMIGGNGEVPIIAKSGEYVINSDTASRPGMNQFLKAVNTNQIDPVNGYGGVTEDTIRTIVREVVSIPVNVVETDISTTQRRINTIETKSVW